MPKPRPGRLTELKIELISLTAAGANGRTLIAKSALVDPKAAPVRLRIAKADSKRQVVYCTVYAPDETDAHDNWATAEDIRQAAYGYMAAGRAAIGKGVDREHDYEPTANHVAESWIVEKDLGKGFLEEPDGAWVVGIHVIDKSDWEKVESGEYSGVSMAGLAVIREDEPQPASVAKGVLADMVEGRKWRDLGWSFSEAVDAVLRDESVTDKKAAIQAIVGELTALTKTKETPVSSFLKRILKAAGFKSGADVVQDFDGEAEAILKAESPTEAQLVEAHGLSAKVLAEMEKADEWQPKLDEALAKAKARLPKPPAAGDDPAAIVKSAIEAGLQPIQTTLTDLGARLEALEKRTPGSSRQDVNGADGDDEDSAFPL